MKKLISIIFVVLLASLFVYSLGYAETKIGLDWSLGKDTMLPETLTSRECDNTVKRITFRYETNEIIKSWESVFIGIEGRYSMHKSDETKDGAYGLGHDAGFKEIGCNLTGKKKWGWVYVGFFAGVSYPMGLGDKIHQLKKGTTLLGTWGPMVGVDIPIYNNWELRLEGRGGHSSGPFEADAGKNWGELTVGVTCTFDDIKKIIGG